MENTITITSRRTRFGVEHFYDGPQKSYLSKDAYKQVKRKMSK